MSTGGPAALVIATIRPGAWRRAAAGRPAEWPAARLHFRRPQITLKMGSNLSQMFAAPRAYLVAQERQLAAPPPIVPGAPAGRGRVAQQARQTGAHTWRAWPELFN